MLLDKKKVAVGLSGGADSTAAAYLLKKEGYNLIGITMVLFDQYDRNGNIIEPQHVKDAKRVAQILDIPHYVVDYRDTFRDIVIKGFVEDYLKGRTPNPCVICNKVIKYGKFIETAKELGAYYVATGHYARIRYDEELKRYRIYKGAAERKDQSYVLYSLKQEQLRHVLLLLGDYQSKEEVKRIADKVIPDVSQKSESTGICFIPNGDYVAYLSSISPEASKPGNFVDIHGNVIGRHRGIVNYTIGQRRGLGKNFNKPMFVVNIDAEKNEVVLGDDIDTYSIGLIGKNANFTLFDELESEIRVEAKVCQWGWFLSAIVSNIGQGRVKVVFDRKERAIAPGQSVVFYQGDELIGGAVIESVF